MKNIRHLFFDLDHTLWDYDANARHVLETMYERFELSSVTTASLDGFLKIYFSENAKLWRAYNNSEIDRSFIRSERFARVLSAMGYQNKDLGLRMSDYFVEECPRQTRLMEGTLDTLNYLKKCYAMSIITNGFNDVQDIKLRESGLSPYFDHVLTSETIGYRKPDSEIFNHALELTGHTHREVVMIGDNPSTDIEGAERAGMRAILFDPHQRYKSTCEIQITRLTELIGLL